MIIKFIHQVNEAVVYAKKVLELTTNTNKKALIILGYVMCIKAALQKQHVYQINYYEQALEAFKK